MPGALKQNLGSGILSLFGAPGIAPYGLRHSGEGAKGLGYFGPLSRPDGNVSTELSSEFEHNGRTVEHPLLVPTLDRSEVNLLLSGAEPTEAIYEKARAFALQRLQSGLSPFAGPQELRSPVGALQPFMRMGVNGQMPQMQMPQRIQAPALIGVRG